MRVSTRLRRNEKEERGNQEKLMIVLEGLNITHGVIVCSRMVGVVFGHRGLDKEQERLHKENTKLKQIIGDLTVELKKPRGIKSMVKRQKSQSVLERNKELLIRIQAIKGDHPAWGYRRV